MKKIKHDKELEKLAEKLMKMPYNKSGTDKSYVWEAFLKGKGIKYYSSNSL